MTAIDPDLADASFDSVALVLAWPDACDGALPEVGGSEPEPPPDCSRRVWTIPSQLVRDAVPAEVAACPCVSPLPPEEVGTGDAGAAG